MSNFRQTFKTVIFFLSNWRYLQMIIRYNGFRDDNFSCFERRFNSKDINLVNFGTISTERLERFRIQNDSERLVQKFKHPPKITGIL